MKDILGEKETDMDKSSHIKVDEKSRITINCKSMTVGTRL